MVLKKLFNKALKNNKQRDLSVITKLHEKRGIKFLTADFASFLPPSLSTDFDNRTTKRSVFKVGVTNSSI